MVSEESQFCSLKSRLCPRTKSFLLWNTHTRTKLRVSFSGLKFIIVIIMKFCRRGERFAFQIWNWNTMQKKEWTWTSSTKYAGQAKRQTCKNVYRLIEKDVKICQVKISKNFNNISQKNLSMKIDMLKVIHPNHCELQSVWNLF